MIATVYEDDSLKIVDGNWFAGSSIRMAFYPTGKKRGISSGSLICMEP